KRGDHRLASDHHTCCVCRRLSIILPACRQDHAFFPGADMAEMLTCEMNGPGLLALHNSRRRRFRGARHDSQVAAVQSSIDSLDTEAQDKLLVFSQARLQGRRAALTSAAVTASR